ncbi:MAG: hypothetical protein ACFCGT_16345 [Sandaracinaceae bacterium]
MRAAFASVLAVLLSCCASRVTTEIEVSLSPDPGCRPARLVRIEVRALGDYPSSQVPVEVVDAAGGAARLDRFPVGSRLLVLRGVGADGWVGEGWARLGAEARVLPRLLLPPGESCLTADPEVVLRDGAMATVLADGRLWLAGGVDDGVVRRSVTTARAGELLGRAVDELLSPRTHGSATLGPGGEAVVVAGGAFAPDSATADTFEVHRVGPEGTLQVGVGRLGAFRQDHGAALVPGGWVLLVGGRASAEGGALRTAERLRVAGDQVTEVAPVDGTLRVGRLGPAVIRLDDGTLLVAGGEGPEGPVASVERYCPPGGPAPGCGAASDSFVGWGDFGSARRGAAYAALPGARLAQVGGEGADGRPTGRLEVLLPDGAAVALADLPAPVERPTALGLPDGRLLVAGVGPDGSTAWLVDPSGAATELGVSRAARRLVPLPDGTIAELNAEGLSYRRLDTPAPYEDPPPRLDLADPEDRALVVEDGPGRWRVDPEAGVLRAALADATLLLPVERYTRLDLTLTGEPPLAVLRRPEGAAPVAIQLLEGGVRAPGCELLASGSPSSRWTLRFDGTRVDVEVDGRQATCRLDVPDEPFAVGLRALEAGAGVATIERSRPP